MHHTSNQGKVIGNQPGEQFILTFDRLTFFNKYFLIQFLSISVPTLSHDDK